MLTWRGIRPHSPFRHHLEIARQLPRTCPQARARRVPTSRACSVYAQAACNSPLRKAEGGPPLDETRPATVDVWLWIVAKEPDNFGHVLDVGLGRIRLQIVNARLANPELLRNILLQQLQLQPPLSEVIADCFWFNWDSHHLPGAVGLRQYERRPLLRFREAVHYRDLRLDAVQFDGLDANADDPDFDQAALHLQGHWLFQALTEHFEQRRPNSAQSRQSQRAWGGDRQAVLPMHVFRPQFHPFASRAPHPEATRRWNRRLYLKPDACANISRTNICQK